MHIRKVKTSNQKLQIRPQDLHQGHLERVVSHSRILHNQRPLDIYLPPFYNQNRQQHYPVLYMHDGNNLFYKEIAFGGMPWYVDQTLNRLISLKLVQPLIVVGVANTMGRNNEYTWSKMKTRWGHEGGQGELYARYLIQEVKPMIDQRYRTLTDAWNTGVMGSSLGGLISLYLGLYYPQVFSQIGMVSPSLWWNHREALRDARGFRTGQNLWLDMGTREGNRRAPVNKNINIINTRLLKQILLSRGYIEGHNLGYLEDKGALHNEWWWGQRLHVALMFLFGTAKGRALITAK